MPRNIITNNFALSIISFSITTLSIHCRHTECCLFIVLLSFVKVVVIMLNVVGRLYSVLMKMSIAAWKRSREHSLTVDSNIRPVRKSFFAGAKRPSLFLPVHRWKWICSWVPALRRRWRCNRFRRRRRRTTSTTVRWRISTTSERNSARSRIRCRTERRCCCRRPELPVSNGIKPLGTWVHIRNTLFSL